MLRNVLKTTKPVQLLIQTQRFFWLTAMKSEVMDTLFARTPFLIAMCSFLVASLPSSPSSSSIREPSFFNWCCTKLRKESPDRIEVTSFALCVLSNKDVDICSFICVCV